MFNELRMLHLKKKLFCFQNISNVFGYDIVFILFHFIDINQLIGKLTIHVLLLHIIIILRNIRNP